MIQLWFVYRLGLSIGKLLNYCLQSEILHIHLISTGWFVTRDKGVQMTSTFIE